MFYEKIKSNWIEILIYLGGYKEKSPCMQGEISMYARRILFMKREIFLHMEKKSLWIEKNSSILREKLFSI